MGDNFKSPYWESDDEMKEHRKRVIIESCVFAYLTFMIIISVVKTIKTNPGNIPIDKEWDIYTSDSGLDNISAISSSKSDNS